MNITADENIPFVKEAFSTLGTVRTVNGRTLNAADLKQTDILLVRSVTQVNQALLESTSVKYVASATAGFNHIDLDYLHSQAIGFSRAPGSNAISAAEYVLAGIAYWAKKENKTLSGLSIGIVGCGNVGSRVKRLCDAIGMHCVINDPPLEQQHNTDYIFSSLNEALACDIVTLHTPLSRDGDFPTYQLMNSKRINKIKKGGLFINAARGEVVEEPALLDRMQKQNDLTLILDVWENEPRIATEMLKKTLIGTPHIAGYSIDGKIRGTEMIYQSVCKFLDVAPGWFASDVSLDGVKPSIELNAEQNQLDEILEAYDIEADSKQLKKILSDQSLTNDVYFDSLRKNYPPRREYSTLD